MGTASKVSKLFDLGDTALETDEGINYFEAVSISLNPDFPDLLEDPCVENQYYPLHGFQ